MATRKVTFTLPEELAMELQRLVPASNRSQYVAAAIAAQFQARRAELARACEAANQSADVRDIEDSFDAFVDEADRVQEPW